MRGAATGGQVFISVAIKKVKPHITLGIITFVLDICTIILGTALVFKDIDGLIYGVVVTYLMAMVMDRIMYGIDEGKMTLIVTDKGAEIANRIYERHTVLTKMLEGLGVCDEIARADACKMEHDVSDESFEKIKEHLKAKGEI